MRSNGAAFNLHSFRAIIEIILDKISWFNFGLQSGALVEIFLFEKVGPNIQTKKKLESYSEFGFIKE